MTVFRKAYGQYLSEIERILPEFLPPQPAENGGLPVEAARYSLLGGGKRIRPVLLLAVCDLLGGGRAAALPFACALEMIHTYSLIHDDLPAMDDDDLRRGRPTCHKVYGEAIAVLAGDTLLNRAYEILLDTIRPRRKGTWQAARLIAAASGSQGMIGGQALDLTAGGKTCDLDRLRRMHGLKTGALLKAPILAGASLAGASVRVRRQLAAYGDAIGLAFQIQDDILDATATAANLGKTAGKDRRDDKATYVNILGLDEARRQLDGAIAEAQACLGPLRRQGLRTDFLEGFSEYLIARTS
jgi:geranylgeranyl diphosphate synthase, type II